jgi:hypothetical protein
MFGNIHEDDKQINEFKVHKEFTFTHYNDVDTASPEGVFSYIAQSGSFRGANGEGNSGGEGWTTSSAAVNTNVSGGREYKAYKVPLYNQIKLNFFEFQNAPNRVSAQVPQPQHALDNIFRPFGRGALSGSVPHYQKLGLRKIHNKANIVAIPRRFMGEGIKTGSISISDYSSGGLITVKDDGYGNLYDKAYEQAFLSGSPDSNGSGSALGTVSYTYGLVMLTDTGSRYTSIVAGTTGSDGWKLSYRATKTIQEHQYQVIIPENKFNHTTNISITHGRSGSFDVPPGMDSKELRTFLPPAEGQYDTVNGYSSSMKVEDFATHSFFAPYVTTVGLYNDLGDLLAIAKPSRPIRNDPELALSFIIRFDV